MIYMDFLITRTASNPKIRMNTHESYVIRMRAKTKPKEIGTVWRAHVSVYRTLEQYSIAFQTCSMSLEAWKSMYWLISRIVGTN